MWFKKQKEVINPPPDKVKCDDCKHYIDKEDAQIFPAEFDCSDSSLYAISFPSRFTLTYCPLHKKPYDIIEDGKFYKLIPQRKVEVNSAGKEKKKEKRKHPNN